MSNVHESETFTRSVTFHYLSAGSPTRCHAKYDGDSFTVALTDLDSGARRVISDLTEEDLLQIQEAVAALSLPRPPQRPPQQKAARMVPTDGMN